MTVSVPLAPLTMIVPKKSMKMCFASLEKAKIASPWNWDVCVPPVLWPRNTGLDWLITSTVTMAQK